MAGERPAIPFLLQTIFFPLPQKSHILPGVFRGFPSEDMSVTRCICFDQSFESALRTAREHACTTVAGLQEYLAISGGCGLCVPYVQRTIETGETVIPVMDEGDSAYWRGRAGEVRKEKRS